MVDFLNSLQDKSFKEIGKPVKVKLKLNWRIFIFYILGTSELRELKLKTVGAKYYDIL